MAPGTLTKQNRKLAEKIDGHDVYAKDLVNDDLDVIDERMDDYAELQREIADLEAQVRSCDDKDERNALRAQVRAMTREMRAMDTQMLGLYIEDKLGEPFTPEDLAKLPVRAQTILTRQATEKIYGDAEGPTPGTSASA
jgi:hypothetical protein